MKRILLAAALLFSCPALAAPAGNDGWITHPAAAGIDRPIVLHFRRVFDLAQVSNAMPVTVTADNRFILFINGHRAASGPSMGTIAHWRTSTIDLAPYLRPGRNIIAAAVWDFVRKKQLSPGTAGAPAASALPATEVAPIAQQSVALGFRVTGGALATSEPGWRVKIDEGHLAGSGRQQVPRRRYYVASAPETIDAAKVDWDWAGDAETGAGWTDAVPAPDAAARTLVADRLLPQSFTPAAPGMAVRSDIDANTFPTQAITVPANTHAHILLRRDAVISAYPELTVSGGAGATIKLTYTEALYDADGKKGDRDLVGDRRALGIFDTFVADGARRSFAPLWWRTWRYAELDIQTGTAPLTLETFKVYETGYPFHQAAHFTSSDAALNRIWDIGWRTAQVDAHETYMDSAYWEQLQYTGDTRLQMLISYAVSGDPRLGEQAIDAFAESDADGGLEQGAYPSRSDNVIATFSLAWIGMLSDWSMRQPDPAPIARHLPRMRAILTWFEPWRTADGLLGKNPQWNFIDWVGSSNDRLLFPSYGKDGGSCLTTVMWVGALRQGAVLEQAYGDKQQGAADTAKADAAQSAIRQHCWDKSRGLFADNSDFGLFSQHMNALAVLYDVATPQEAPQILARITLPGHGIDAPPGMFASSYYFGWYMARAFEHAGLADRYLDLLQTWRDLLALHYTTWPEMRGDTRSDTHAWSAHPTADLLDVVAGIEPAAPGYARLRVAPHLGDLTSLDATAATPKGAVSVRYKLDGHKLTADVDRPTSLPGTFVWRGKEYPLAAAHSHLVIAY